MIKKIETITLDDMSHLLELYVIPLFSDEHSNCLVVCHSAKSDSIYKDFVKK